MCQIGLNQFVAPFLTPKKLCGTLRQNFVSFAGKINRGVRKEIRRKEHRGKPKLTNKDSL
jgi:hypothetical protein